ncbi:MAG: AIR synthase-related protein, partial [Acidimicrobiia bacterium]
NLGNPEKSEVMWQLVETIEGIAEACRALGIPVVGGNVSLYNETDGQDIYPTPVVGLLGLADPMPERPPRLDRAEPGMDLWLLGREWAINLAGSAFEQVTFGHVGGRPSAPDPTMALAACQAARRLATEEIAHALHDLSDGGLAVAVAEVCIRSGVGASLRYSDWRHLFCEDPHRLVAAVEPGQAFRVEALAAEVGMPATRIGVFGGEEISFERAGAKAVVDLGVAAHTWREAIPRRLGGADGPKPGSLSGRPPRTL